MVEDRARSPATARHSMPMRPEMRGRFVELVLLARGHGHARAHFTQALRHLQADAARAAGDDRHLAAQVEEIPDAHCGAPPNPTALDVKFQDVVPSIQLEEADGSKAVSSYQEDRVDAHKNARSTPAGRLRMAQAVVAGEAVSSVARRCRTDRKSVRKWVVRYRASRANPACVIAARGRIARRALLHSGTAQRVITLRRRRWTMAQIASASCTPSRATV